MGAKFSQGRVLAFFIIYSCGLCALQLILQAGGAEALGEPVVPMKKYTIDLDQPPSERWIPLLKDFKSSAPLIVDYFSDQVSLMKGKRSIIIIIIILVPIIRLDVLLPGIILFLFCV